MACWCEGVLAQKVLLGKTKGYRQHPQLIRFRTCPDPLAAMATYLVFIADEAEARGYAFNRSKIIPGHVAFKIPVTLGQILYEWDHLKAKLTLRDLLRLAQTSGIETPESHPLFVIIPGGVEHWEKEI